MKLINKDAIVAEIEKRIESCAKLRENMLNVQCHDLADYASARIGELNCIQDFINTLEVKEVNIDKEIEQSFIDLDYHLDAYNRVEDYVGENIDMVEYKRIAKYFFELGMQVSNKAQKG